MFEQVAEFSTDFLRVSWQTYHAASQRLKEVGARVAHFVLAVGVAGHAVVDHRVPSSTAAPATHAGRSMCGQVRCVRSTAEVRNEKVDSSVWLRENRTNYNPLNI